MLQIEKGTTAHLLSPSLRGRFPPKLLQGSGVPSGGGCAALPAYVWLPGCQLPCFPALLSAGCLALPPRPLALPDLLLLLAPACLPFAGIPAQAAARAWRDPSGWVLLPPHPKQSQVALISRNCHASSRNSAGMSLHELSTKAPAISHCQR